MSVLPWIDTDAAFAKWRTDPACWQPLVRMIAAALGMPAEAARPFGTGTNLVLDLDGRSVLKVFPPLYGPQFTSERATLRRLGGRLSVSVPQLLAEGESDGWSWLLMSNLDGIVGSQAWPMLPEADKHRLIEEIGRTIAEVQAVPPGPLSALEPAWPEFVRSQAAGCVERHRRQNLAPRLLAELEEMLADVPTLIPVDQPPVILTGEWIPENLLLAEQNGRWRLAAVIDFGDVITGWREYDLLGPSTFLCAGDPRRVRCLFDGYGLAPADRDAALRRRLLLLTLLHRASDLRGIAIPGWERRTQRLSDLERIIWPTTMPDGSGPALTT